MGERLVGDLVSKLFVNVLHNTITDYQMIVSNDLIIKTFETGFQLSDYQLS